MVATRPSFGDDFEQVELVPEIHGPVKNRVCGTGSLAVVTAGGFAAMVGSACDMQPIKGEVVYEHRGCSACSRFP